MKDVLLDNFLDMLKEEAIKIGSDLIREGIETVRERLSGEVSDETLISYIKSKQKGREQ